MEQNFIENELIIVTKATLDKFLKEENPADLIALYIFLKNITLLLLMKIRQ